MCWWPEISRVHSYEQLEILHILSKLSTAEKRALTGKIFFNCQHEISESIGTSLVKVNEDNLPAGKR